jgi:hypothetical protein
VRRGKIAAFVTDHINALYFTQVSSGRKEGCCSSTLPYMSKRAGISADEATVEQPCRFLLELHSNTRLPLVSCLCNCFQVRPCDLALGSEVVGSGSLVLGLQPNSTIRRKLDDAMLKLAESGQVPGEANFALHCFDVYIMLLFMSYHVCCVQHGVSQLSCSGMCHVSACMGGCSDLK